MDNKQAGKSARLSQKKGRRDSFRYLKKIKGAYFYTIQPGDSIWRLCYDFAIFPKELRANNAVYFLKKRKNGEPLNPGEKLSIPVVKRKAYKNILASHYGEGDGFDGKPMANGDIMDKDNAFIFAHRDYPLNLPVRVINPANGRSITGRILDRGPYYFKAAGQRRKKIYARDIDLSAAAAKALGYFQKGITKLHIEPLNPLVMAKIMQ